MWPPLWIRRLCWRWSLRGRWDRRQLVTAHVHLPCAHAGPPMPCSSPPHCTVVISSTSASIWWLTVSSSLTATSFRVAPPPDHVCFYPVLLLFLSIVTAAICSHASLSLLISFLSVVSVVEQIVSLFCPPADTSADWQWHQIMERQGNGGDDNVMGEKGKRSIALKRTHSSSLMELNSFDCRVWSNVSQV